MMLIWVNWVRNWTQLGIDWCSIYPPCTTGFKHSIAMCSGWTLVCKVVFSRPAPTFSFSPSLCSESLRQSLYSLLLSFSSTLLLVGEEGRVFDWVSVRGRHYVWAQDFSIILLFPKPQETYWSGCRMYSGTSSRWKFFFRFLSQLQRVFTVAHGLQFAVLSL